MKTTTTSPWRTSRRWGVFLRHLLSVSTSSLTRTSGVLPRFCTSGGRRIGNSAALPLPAFFRCSAVRTSGVLLNGSGINLVLPNEFLLVLPNGSGIKTFFKNYVTDLWNMVSGEYRHPVPVSPDTVIQYRHPVPDRYWKHPVPHPNSLLIRYPSSRTGWRYRVLDTGNRVPVLADTSTGWQ